jgi:methylase of polypeptide subunit release factors
VAAAAVSTALRTAFARAGYDEECIAGALRVDPPAQGAHARANARRLTAGDPLGTLIRLFTAGEAVTRADAERALDVEEACAAGLLAIDGDRVEAPLALVEWQGFLVAHDHEAALPLPADHVTGISNATRTLAALTIRRPVDRALDIGTGCGTQALLASRHAREVVATDITARSLDVARLNLALNGIDNVELREGSLFDPVAGERFDLIATNPPFVVSPDSELVFRDGGFERDNLSRLVVTELPRHLAPGGFASTLVCWTHGADEEWSRPLRRWLAGSGCDAFVVRYVVEDPLEYALKWAEQDAVDRWLDYYEAAGIEALSTGGVVLRRRADGRDGWIETVDAETGPSGSASDQLLRIFAAHDFGGDLLDECLALVPHRLEERLAWREGAYRPEHLALALDDGVGVEVPVEPAALPALFRLNGERPLRELPDAEAALPAIRRLFALGFAERR